MAPAIRGSSKGAGTSSRATFWSYAESTRRPRQGRYRSVGPRSRTSHKPRQPKHEPNPTLASAAQNRGGGQSRISGPSGTRGGSAKEASGFRELTVHLTEEARAHGLAAAVPARFTHLLEMVGARGVEAEITS
jgi:hypothetical protein